MIHDAREPNPGIHYMLAGMKYPDYPVALGIIRAVDNQTYDAAMLDQHVRVKETSKIKCVDDLLHEGSTWEV
ncbi:MAG: hypothetical protein E4G92_02925 [Bacteroidia bacterium]|nr:MAG: hypothetical protein E4G92_02925 [Bacteroidia bacterium]